MSIFYIADTHFGHANIIQFDKRPFATVAEMDAALIANWNNNVQKQDTVYILGDFCWNREPRWIEILDQLRGEKILIRGNHDPIFMSTRLKQRFQYITDYKEIKDDGRWVIMSHYPIPFYKKAYDPNTYMLCGHVHLTRENDFLNDIRRELIKTHTDEWGNSCGHIFNVGCMTDSMEYCPKTLSQIIEDHEYLFRTNVAAL